MCSILVGNLHISEWFPRTSHNLTLTWQTKNAGIWIVKLLPPGCPWKFFFIFYFYLNLWAKDKVAGEWTCPGSLSGYEEVWSEVSCGLFAVWHVRFFILFYLVPCCCLGDLPGCSFGNLSQMYLNHDRRKQWDNFPVINVELRSDRKDSSLPPTHTLLTGVYNSAHLILSVTGHRSNNTAPKNRCNPSKPQVALQIGCPDLHIFPSFHTLPPSHSLPQAPPVVATLSWNRAFAGWRQQAAARTCHITLRSTVGPGHLSAACKGGLVRADQTHGNKDTSAAEPNLGLGKHFCRSSQGDCSCATRDCAWSASTSL